MTPSSLPPPGPPPPDPPSRKPAVALLLLGALLVAVAVGGWIAFIAADHARSLRETERELIRLTGLLEEHGHRTIASSGLVLRRLADVIGTTDPDTLRGSGEMYHLLRGMARELPEVGYIRVLNARGEAVASSLRREPLTGTYDDRDYFRAHATAAAGGGAFVGELLHGRFTGLDFFSVSRPLRGSDGAFQGVVVVALVADYFQTFYRALGLGRDGTAAIMRTDGALLVREPLPENPVGRRFPKMAGGLTPETPLEVFIGASPVDSVRRVVARRLVPEYGLVVLASRSVDAALAGWRLRAVQTALVGSAVIVTAGLLLAMGLRALIRQHAMEAALRDARGLLERRVEERTASLAAANADLERTVAHRDLLLREVYHRVKNNMQQVDALIALQSRDLRHEEARRALHDMRLRVNALGTVHQQLLQSSDLRTFSLRGFLEDLCAAIAFSVGARPRGITLRVEADPMPVDFDLAIPLGLLVNEWVSNAFRHAFPDGRAGTITVTARRAAGRLTLRVSDDGVGCTPEKLSGRSTGTRIVEALARQLRATTTLEAPTTPPAGPARGTTCVATIPLEEEMQHA